MNNIVLLGAGGHAKACIEVIESADQYKILGLIDTSDEAVSGYKVLGNDSFLRTLIQEMKGDLYFLVAIGQLNPMLRINLFELVKTMGARPSKIIASNAYVSRRSQIGEGTIIMHYAMLNNNVIVGQNVIVNNKALIEHDCVIGDHVNISTGAIVNGTCKIGERVYVGSNAVISNNVTIAPDVVIGAGSVIINDVYEAGVYVGNPARRIK